MGTLFLQQVFSVGCMNRTTAATDMNERSSSSLSVLTIDLSGGNVNTNVEVSGEK